MENDRGNLTIGTFARAAGVNVETIRFYQRKGLLLEPPRPLGGVRRYGESDVARVKFVKSAQRLGFNLDQVAQLLRLEDGTNCNEAAEIAAHRLDDVRARLNDLLRIEAALSTLVRECRTRQEDVACPLIAALQHNTAGPANAAGSFGLLRRAAPQ